LYGTTTPYEEPTTDENNETNEKIRAAPAMTGPRSEKK